MYNKRSQLDTEPAMTGMHSLSVSMPSAVASLYLAQAHKVDWD